MANLVLFTRFSLSSSRIVRFRVSSVGFLASKPVSLPLMHRENDTPRAPSLFPMRDELESHLQARIVTYESDGEELPELSARHVDLAT